MEPTASRPYMPDYPIQPASDGLLPWTWAAERLERSHEFWVTTVDPSGRPAVTPVWGVIVDGDIWFSCGPTSRKARNAGARPDITVATNDPKEPVVVEGRATFIDDRPSIERFAAATEAKYHSGSTVDFFMANAVIRVVPRQVIGMDEADFTGSPTRWQF